MICSNCFWDDICLSIFKTDDCNDFTPLVIEDTYEKEYGIEKYQFMEDWDEYERLYN